MECYFTKNSSERLYMCSHITRVTVSFIRLAGPFDNEVYILCTSIVNCDQRRLTKPLTPQSTITQINYTKYSFMR